MARMRAQNCVSGSEHSRAVSLLSGTMARMGLTPNSSIRGRNRSQRLRENVGQRSSKRRRYCAGTGTTVVASDQEISDLFGITAGSNFQAQYQRKKKVLTVHSDVAKAIPATPSQRINTTFSTISSNRFTTPQ